MTFRGATLGLLCILALTSLHPSPTDASPRGAGWALLETLPHDPTSFTQGLAIVGERLYESSGRYGQSWVEYRPLPHYLSDGRDAAALQHQNRRSPPSAAFETSHEAGQRDQPDLKHQPHRRSRIPGRWFAEGLTAYGGELYLLTWRAGRALVLDPDTLEIRRQHRYSGEGWGLTEAHGELIVSDGSSELRFLDPASFRELRRLQVTEQGRSLSRLNELEWVDGWILANVWQSDDVAIIDPANGKVIDRLRLGALWPPAERNSSADVLNGLAWDAATATLLVTGKLWPRMYRLRIQLPVKPSTAE